MSYGDTETLDRPRSVPNSEDPPGLRTRKPTGVVSFPLVLVEGEEKAGKTFVSLRLTASERVGRSFVLELGESTVDEYASLGDFEVLEHDGTFASILAQLRLAMSVPSDPAKPNVIVIDTVTAVWTLLKKWTDGRARNSKRNKDILARDPDAEIDPTMNLWNDAKDRWRLIMDELRAWPGIAVVVARGKEVAKVQNGQPVAGETDYSIEAEKTLASDVSAWVQMKRPHKATLVAVRSLLVNVPPKGLDLPEENPLEHLVFSVLGSGGFGPSNAVNPTVGIRRDVAKARIVAAVQVAAPALSQDEAVAEAKRLWEEGFPGNPSEVSEAALAKLEAWIASEDPTPPSGGGEKAPQAAQNGSSAPEPAEDGGAPPAAQDDPWKGKETWAQFQARINALAKRDLVPHLVEAGLPTSGKVEDMKTRLLDKFRGFFPDAEEADAKAVESAAEALGGTVEEEPTGGAWDKDVPEGWKEEPCLCGEQVMYEPGNFTETVTHRNSALNLDHKADVAFN